MLYRNTTKAVIEKDLVTCMLLVLLKAGVDLLRCGENKRARWLSGLYSLRYQGLLADKTDR